LTRDSAIPYLTGLTIAPITTTIRSIPTEVFLSPADGMPVDCVVNLDNLQTVRKAGLGTYITHLSPALMREVRAGLEFALGFDTLQ
jgi:mRNA interferase MazF